MGSENFAFPLFDSATGTLMLPWWAATAIVALTVVAIVLSMPGSPLACLDAVVGETVEAACERLLFGAPEMIAAATAYTAARVALLSDGIDFAVRSNASYEGALPGLRRALEADRFGFV